MPGGISPSLVVLLVLLAACAVASVVVVVWMIRIMLAFVGLDGDSEDVSAGIEHDPDLLLEEDLPCSPPPS